MALGLPVVLDDGAKHRKTKLDAENKAGLAATNNSIFVQGCAVRLVWRKPYCQTPDSRSEC
jgi:hypothetical protein